MTNVRPLPLLLALVLASAACLPAIAGDVPRITSPAQPRDGATVLELEEVWRAGDPDDDQIFGMITQVRQDRDGSIYVMDAQLSQVHVYSPGGEHLRTLFGEGEGPGEIRGPRDLVLLDDGRVGAVQEVPGKLVFVDRAGLPAGSMRIGGAGTEHGGFCQTFSAFTNGRDLLVAGFLQSPGERPGTMNQTSFLSRFDGDGRTAAEIARMDNELVFEDFVFDENRHLAPFWWNAAVAADGRVYAAPDLDRYEIRVFDRDGGLRKIIEREYEPLQRSSADREYFTDVVRAIYSGLPFEVGVEINDHEPAVAYMHRGLRLHDDGSLWVLTSRGIREPGSGAMASFDVFDPDGVYVRRVDVHGPWNGRTDTVFFLDDGHALVVTGFADAMMTQFTGGNMTVDVDGEAGSMEVIYCRLAE
jgi:sugar lactone lactonase YvrE